MAQAFIIFASVASSTVQPKLRLSLSLMACFMEFLVNFSIGVNPLLFWYGRTGEKGPESCPGTLPHAEAVRLYEQMVR